MPETIHHNRDMPYVHELCEADLLALQSAAAAAACTDSVYFRDPMGAAGLGPEMAVIPPGLYEMGSTKTEFGHQPDEGPQHYVFIEQAFALGRYTITADEFELFRSETGWYLRDDLIWAKGRFPVINIDIATAMGFTRWLSERTGQHYRLPTEAEWEYAARAGSKKAFAFGDSVSCREVHFYSAYPYDEAKQNKRWWLPRCMPLARSLMVGSLRPNLWGLFDMHGNVWEFTSSPWTRSHISHRRDGRSQDHASRWIVTKGGSWFEGAVRARSAARNPRLRVELDVNLGFRVVRELGRDAIR